MDRMLVVVFDKENSAYEGKRALQELKNEGSIGVYAYAVLSKNADGTATIKQGDDSGPIGTLVGTAFGSLIGILGGPVGMVAGATTGMSAGAAADLSNASLGADFLDDVTKELKPNKVALVAEIDEEWVTPVDTRMEEQVAAMKADLAQLKAEHAQGRADQKAKLQEKINALDSRIQAQLEKAKLRRDAAAAQAKVKAEVQSVKAAVARAKAS